MFSLSSWNIASTHHYSSLDYSRVSPHIDIDAQDILCLQEFDAPFEKLDKSYHDALYDQADPQSHNVVLTRFLVTEQREIALPETRTRCFESVQVITLSIHNVPVVIYNCHLPIVGVGLVERMALLDSAIEDAGMHDFPTIICGDLNSTVPPDGWRRLLVRLVHRIPRKTLFDKHQYFSGDERDLVSERLQRAGFSEIFPIQQATWAFPRTRLEVLGLKLDWISIRGLQCVGQFMHSYVTDHRRLDVRLKLPD